MLYKRPFRKEKEVATFLIKDKMAKSAFNLRIDPRPYQSEASQWEAADGLSPPFPLARARRLSRLEEEVRRIKGEDYC